MTKAKCTHRFKDKQGNVILYRLVDNNGDMRDVDPRRLKSAISQKLIDIVNLQLTADGKFICRKVIDIELQNNSGTKNEELILKYYKCIAYYTEKYGLDEDLQGELIVGLCEVINKWISNDKKDDKAFEINLHRYLDRKAQSILNEHIQYKSTTSNMEDIDDLEHNKLLDIIQRVGLDKIDELLDTLSKRKEKIIRMRFGLPPYYESMSYREIAKQFNVTSERIRQLETSALYILNIKLTREEVNGLIYIENIHNGQVISLDV